MAFHFSSGAVTSLHPALARYTSYGQTGPPPPPLARPAPTPNKLLPSVSAWQPLQPSVPERFAAACWPVQQLATQLPAVLQCPPCASQLPHTPLQPL